MYLNLRCELVAVHILVYLKRIGLCFSLRQESLHYILAGGDLMETGYTLKEGFDHQPFNGAQLWTN
jgi:hypothetical protein